MREGLQCDRFATLVLYWDEWNAITERRSPFRPKKRVQSMSPDRASSTSSSNRLGGRNRSGNASPCPPGAALPRRHPTPRPRAQTRSRFALARSTRVATVWRGPPARLFFALSLSEAPTPRIPRDRAQPICPDNTPKHEKPHGTNRATGRADKKPSARPLRMPVPCYRSAPQTPGSPAPLLRGPGSRRGAARFVLGGAVVASSSLSVARVAGLRRWLRARRAGRVWLSVGSRRPRRRSVFVCHRCGVVLFGLRGVGGLPLCRSCRARARRLSVLGFSLGQFVWLVVAAVWFFVFVLSPVLAFWD